GFRQVGKPLTRTDAPGKAHGKTPYAGDYSMSDMLHAKVLRSPLPSARLKHLDVSKARTHPGVACVLTFSDLKKGTVATDIPGQTGFKRRNTDQQILVEEVIRYQGEPIALVAAETISIAQKAIDLIEFELEPIQGVFDPFEALKPDAPRIFGHDNIVASYKVRKGDVESGFAAADTIVENTFKTQFIEHAFLEPEVGLGWVDEQGVINIRVSTQCVEHFRYVAEALDVPQSKVRIRGALVGGGFGGKSDVTVELYLALLTTATGRPVRLCYSREESFYGHGKRHPFTISHKTGFTKDGTITAARIDITSESGPYAFMSPYVLLYATEAGPGPYLVENIHIDSRCVATNNMYTSAFRGFGATQACIAYEQHMDEAAKVLGIDPRELRRRNFLKTGDPIVTGFKIESAVWTDKCMDLAWEALGERNVDIGPVKIGRGVAAYQQGYGRLIWLHDTAEGWVGIEMDGTVVVRSGITDIGAGQTSSLAQIAGEVLGVAMNRITVYNSDSSTTPLAGTSTATRGLYMSGNAVRLAAQAVRSRLAKRAAQQFGADPNNIDFADGTVFIAGDRDRSIALKELVGICASEGIHRSELAIFRAPFGDWINTETGQGRAHPDYTYGAHAVEVAVDTETGEVTILKSVGAHDVGQAVNPDAVEGQIEGGAAQGHGYALSEELIYKEGCLVTPSLSEYLCPTSMDSPRIQSIILESRSGLGPFGAKGIGEPGHTPAAAAVANAVADAIGARIFSLPITPEKICAALEAIKAN
ncbi:MAG: xanthine dehydrogenase family protein molybdopterin-binding subunit, partial [Alphaproteobacteria bacterium]